MKRKAVVAMSGGVDSSVAAALMVEEGYDVTGVMLKLWRGDEMNLDSGCCSLSAAEDARRVAHKLDIPFYVFNLADEFERSVIEDFRTTYASGRTPNPCVRCNQWIKFDLLLERAKAIGADLLATGHYARVTDHHGRYELRRGADPHKDQSYVMWMLTQDELAHVRFPVGDMTKTETRAMAAGLGLRTATKPDSQEICFVRQGNVGAYVEEHVPAAAEPGPIVDSGGRVLGEHKGIARFTVGQRKGLGISLGHPVFVTRIDAATNSVVVGNRRELAASACTLDELSWTSEPPSGDQGVLVQHRAHGEVWPARVSGSRLEFDRPVEAVAPGQSAALYSRDEPDLLLGGGVISATLPAAVPA